MATKKATPKKATPKKATGAKKAVKASPKAKAKPRSKAKVKADLQPVRRMAAIAANSVLEMSVDKTGGPMSTHARVVSTGTDSQSFADADLTPGPARKGLDGNNSYTIVWTLAFVEDGSATLDVSVLGSQPSQDSVTVDGNAGDIKKRIVVVP